MAIRLRDRPVVQRECAGPGRCRCATCGDDQEHAPDAAQLLVLQRQAGNSAVADLVRPIAVQRGLLGDLVDGNRRIAGCGIAAAERRLRDRPQGAWSGAR